MPLRKAAKGISEYVTGRPAVRTALYLNYRNLEGKPVKEKVDTLDIVEAKRILANKKADLLKQKKRLGTDEGKLKRAVATRRMTRA